MPCGDVALPLRPSCHRPVLSLRQVPPGFRQLSFCLLQKQPQKAQKHEEEEEEEEEAQLQEAGKRAPWEL